MIKIMILPKQKEDIEKPGEKESSEVRQDLELESDEPKISAFEFIRLFYQNYFQITK